MSLPLLENRINNPGGSACDWQAVAPMTNALDRLNHLADRWTPRIVVSVIAAAFILSYTALLALAIAAGYHPLLAWLWPLVLDGVVVVASLSLLKR